MDLIELAHCNGRAASKSLSRTEQKNLGQFMTPPAIARLMASRSCIGLERESVTILEPAAGAGILAAAVVEQLLRRPAPPSEIRILLWELDKRLIPLLKRLAIQMRHAGRLVGTSVRVSIREGDFLLTDASLSGQFDLVIANPPYFKIGKSDARALKHGYAVYGQPNVYGLFMAACARLVSPGGRWCFITPRSWTNGTYFRAARAELLRCLKIEAVHLFESRERHFAEDEVLQEAMITWATARSSDDGAVVISISEGIGDLATASLRTVSARDLISRANNAIVLPVQENSPTVNHLPATLASLGLKVSTGPVVAFRAIDHIREAAGRTTVPLLWMQHVRPMRIVWPINKKREHIRANSDSAWMLLPNHTMVVMRRFSPKEDERRIIAAPYVGGSMTAPRIGLENHTNYIHRPGGSMSRSEAIGLAAFLNSKWVDTYLRSVAGNTQINAADVRTLPLPRMCDLVAIGDSLGDCASLLEIDDTVTARLGDHQRKVA